MKRILFVTVGSKENPSLYARCIPPLVRVCETKGIDYVCICFFKETQKYLLANHVKAVYPLNQIDQFFFELYKFFGKAFSLFAFLSTLGLSKGKKRTGLHVKFLTFIKQAYFLTIFKSFKPQIVFIAPDLYFKRIIEIARAFKVPTASALTCLVNKEEHGPINSDKLLLPGKWFQRIYKDKTKTSIVGMIHLDTLIKNYSTHLNGYSVFLTENVSVETTKKYLKEVLETSIFPVIVKLHPVDKRQLYEESVNGYKARLIQNCDLYKLMANSSLVIGQNTTALIEALALHKRIISMDSNSCYNQYPNIKSFVRDYLHSLDGKSSERAMNIMEQMTN